ncbi:MAG: iron-containing redox enzyme family protein [Acidobacteria bacterium]|nr:iron-containing redox enzyme family protein [Acidobacteriota bacterium]
MSFREILLSIMDRKNHWAWPHFSGPDATRPQLFVHYQQEFLTYVRDFPRFLGRVHGACPDAIARRLLAENLFEEETGRLSGTAPHPELFIQMMQGLGFRAARFRTATLLPAAARYRRMLDRVTTRGNWVVAAAVITIFVEGSVKDREALSGRRAAERFDARHDPLARHHGLSARALTLKRAHARVENGHREAAWRIVESQARGKEARAEVIGAMDRSLDLWLAYRDGVARAAGLVPGGTRR